MEVNAEQGVVKYSKLIEDDATIDNEPSLILSQDATINHQIVKETQRKIGFKTLVGLSLVLLMIVTGLVVGLFVMDMKIQRLNHQNLDLQARNQSLSYDLKNMKDALNISKVEIESLKKDIQGLMVQNQKLIKDFTTVAEGLYRAKSKRNEKVSKSKAKKCSNELSTKVLLG